MVVNERPLKRMKRRVTADTYDFLTFLISDLMATRPYPQPQPFREMIQNFLSRHARATFPPSLFSPLTTWQILFRVGDLVLEGSDSAPVIVSLDIIEEDVTRSRSLYCDQCRVVGWSGHPVCRKRFHFIIRCESTPADGGYQKPCSICGNLLRLSESRCKWCDSVITSEELEDWVYSQFEDNTHLLHGVVHSNGYGHLLTVNGREGGSKFLSGFHVMNFWDRLCTALSVRKVSVMDVSKKYGNEYRLLHAIAEGHSWYGKWGYEFGAGSYALTLDAYQMAVVALSTNPLASLMHQGRKPRTRIQNLIAFYQSLSEKELLTLKDLFSFLLSFIQGNHKPPSPHENPKKSEPSTSNVLCVWTRNDVECVQQAMIKVLLAAAGADTWVTRRTLKGAMCKVAKPELVDYSLKHLAGKVASSGMVVHARCNSIFPDLEFRLETLSSVHGGSHSCAKGPTEEQIIGHLKFLYDSIIHPKTMVDYRPLALREHIFDSATKILDCKQFMKDYKVEQNAHRTSPFIHLWCHVELSDEPKDKDDLAIPPELIILPLNATVANLKKEATKAFAEVYAMFKTLEIDALHEYGSIEDTITVRFLVGSSGSIHMRGNCDVKHGLNRYRMERGMESWIVDCLCGAKDDDGERMLACDMCSVWQHTRCSGIDSFDAIPSKFICKRCDNAYSSEPNMEDKNDNISASGTSCRAEVMAIGGPKTASELTMAIDMR